MYTVILKSELSTVPICLSRWTDMKVVTTTAGDAGLTTLKGWIASQAQLMELLREIHAAGHQIVTLRADLP